MPKTQEAERVHEKEPWKDLLAELWRRSISGRRWLGVSPVLLCVVVPGAFGLVSFYASTFATAYAWLSPKVSTLTTDEENLRNEWVAVVTYFPSEQVACEKFSQFKLLYEKYETEKRNGKSGSYALRRDDIVIVRDPELAERWIIANDIFYGPSTAPVVSAELARIARLGGTDSEAQNMYQRIFVSSKVLSYAEGTFEKIYGRIDPAPGAKLDPKKAPYIPC
jgi:hypothetical protein